MPQPTHRIDLVVVSVEPEFLILASALNGLQQSWKQDGLLSGDSVGDDLNGLVQGGFQRLWLDLPGRMVLYANQQGGFRVTCPVTRENIAKDFGAALVRWRSGGQRSLTCPVCTQEHALEGCVLAPPGVFGSSAIIFSSVGGVELTDRARGDLLQAIGPFHVVLRRTL